jgi:hypothetical protein
MEKEIYGFIYYFEFPNGKGYIGQTIQKPFEKRIKSHINDAKRNSNLCFHNALRKFINEYGEENIFDIVEVIDIAYSFEELNSLEIFHIENFNTYYKNENGYNMTLGGEGTNGYIITDEHRELLKQRTTLLWKDPDYRSKMKDAYTDNRKELLSINTHNMWNNCEIRKNMIDGISKSITKKWEDPKYYEKMIIALNNRAKNPEFLKKLSLNQKEVWEDTFYRENQSKKHKELWENPDYREKITNAMKQTHIDNPNLGKEHGEIMKQKHIDNPNLGKEQGERMKKYYDENPEKRIEMSVKKKASFDKPGAREANSKSQLKRFENETIEEKRKRLKRFIKLFEVYDEKTNEKIGEWDLVIDFIKYKNLKTKANTNIGLCLKGECKSSNGYLFKYK